MDVYNIEWVVKECSVGKNCWCRRIETKDGSGVIMEEGFIYKKFAEHVVKIHNDYIIKE